MKPHIGSYRFGTIVIDGKKYHSDVIIFPETIRSWWRKEGHKLKPGDLKRVFSYKPDVLVVGTGSAGVMDVLDETVKEIESQGIELIIKRTDDACKIYNEISGDKKVVAALHLTC